MDILELTLIKNLNEFEFKYRLPSFVTRRLYNKDIIYVGDLVHKSKEELLQLQGIGYKIFNSIKEFLRDINLELGIKYTDKWEELRKVAPTRYRFILTSCMMKHLDHKGLFYDGEYLYDGNDLEITLNSCRFLGQEALKQIAEKEPWYQVGMFDHDNNNG